MTTFSKKHCLWYDLSAVGHAARTPCMGSSTFFLWTRRCVNGRLRCALLPIGRCLNIFFLVLLPLAVFPYNQSMTWVVIIEVQAGDTGTTKKLIFLQLMLSDVCCDAVITRWHSRIFYSVLTEWNIEILCWYLSCDCFTLFVRQYFVVPIRELPTYSFMVVGHFCIYCSRLYNLDHKRYCSKILRFDWNPTLNHMWFY